LKNLETSLKLEAHLMVKNPELVIDDWIESGVKRIIFHFEATKYHQEIIKKIQEAGLEAGIAINPETPIEVLDRFLRVTGYGLRITILIMAVEPGWGGQEFLEETLVKIKRLREAYENVNIEVDGGINLETAPKVIQVGANILASGSVIFESEDIQQTIEALKSIGAP
jgi:ribulose-phosphate 3-epimerase